MLYNIENIVETDKIIYVKCKNNLKLKIYKNFTDIIIDSPSQFTRFVYCNIRNINNILKKYCTELSQEDIEYILLHVI